MGVVILHHEEVRMQHKKKACSEEHAFDEFIVYVRQGRDFELTAAASAQKTATTKQAATTTTVTPSAT